MSAGTMTEDRGIVFSKFEFGGSVSHPKRKKHDLRTTLKKAEIQQEKLKQLQQSNQEKADQIREKEDWKKAIQLAHGVKMKDNPKLLKKTLRKQEKKKEKSTKQWKERVDQLEQDNRRRQQDRLRHIQERKKHGKKTSRAGFEGRLKNK
jgi:hypothetical protein